MCSKLILLKRMFNIYRRKKQQTPFQIKGNAGLSVKDFFPVAGKLGAPFNVQFCR